MTPTAYIVTSVNNPPEESMTVVFLKDGHTFQAAFVIPIDSPVNEVWQNNGYAHWLRPVDLSRMLEDCWKAAVEREDMGDWVQIEEDSPPPDMETYINSVLNSPK